MFATHICQESVCGSTFICDLETSLLRQISKGLFNILRYTRIKYPYYFCNNLYLNTTVPGVFYGIFLNSKDMVRWKKKYQLLLQHDCKYAVAVWTNDNKV